MEHASTVDIGTRKRRRDGINEDSIATAVLENHHRQRSRPVGIFVLGDGVGGEASGDVASSLATTVVRKRLTEEVLGSVTDAFERFGIDAYRGDPPTVADGETVEAELSADRVRTAIQEGVDAAHEHVQAFAREIDGRPATTLVVGVYVDGRLHYGWVGDSRIYLVNTTHGAIQQLTRDHAVTNELLDRGEIADEEYARVHGDATAITNAIGGSAHGKPTVDVEFGSTEVYGDDVILFTSDGLIDAYPDVRPLREAYQAAEDTGPIREEIRETLVTDDEIRDIVLEASDLHEAVERLISFANERGGKDNLSITLARDPHADPAPESIPGRGATVDPPSVADQKTVIESGDDESADGDRVSDATATDAASGSDGAVDSTDTADATAASDGNADSDANGATEETASIGEASTGGASTDAESTDVVSVGPDGPPTAAITVGADATVFEIGDGVTIGRGAGATGEGPDIDVAVEDDIVEGTHARVEYRDGDWRVRDTSSSGTYVEESEGEWALLLSSEGAEFHRQHGFDPGAAVERDLSETSRLRDGTAFTLEDPRNDDPITLRFFESVDGASGRDADDGAATGTRFDRFLV